MKAVYDLPEDLLQKVVKASKAKSKKEAIILALKEYLRKKRLKKFTEMFGNFDVKMDHKKLREYRK